MKDNTITFEQFAQAAARRMEEKKKHRTEKLKLKDMNDMVLEIRGLSDTELNDCYDFSDNAIEIDKYTLYCASVTLQETAKILVQQGKLQAGQEYKITEMFKSTERRFIVQHILSLSGVDGEADIEVIKETEEVKNF